MTESNNVMDSLNYSWIKLKGSTIDIFFISSTALTLSGSLLVLTAVISEYPGIFFFIVLGVSFEIDLVPNFHSGDLPYRKTKAGISK